MFDLVHKHKTLVQIMLGLITLPFAFWGIDSYRRGTSTVQDIAEVGGQKITVQEFGQAQRDQQERLRGLLGRNFDPALLDTPRESELIALLAAYPGILSAAADLREPHRVARYLEDLASGYHKFYDTVRVLPRGDEETGPATVARLWLCAATRPSASRITA